MHMSILDYLVVLLYILSFIGIGIYVSKKKVKSSADFANAGQSMGLFTVVGSTVATCMGASIIFGNFQLVHAGGIKALVSTYFWFFGWMFLVILSGRLRASGAVSIPEFLEKKYNPLARRIASYAVLCMGISSTAAQFKSVGSMSAALNLTDASTGIIIGALVILLFTVFSGLWGVAITDTIQSIMILVTVGVVLPIVAIKVVGGPSAALGSIEPSKLSFSGSTMTTGLFVGYALSNIFSCGAHPAYAQRSLAAKDNKTAVRGQLIALVICAVITAVAVFPALFINKIFPDMTDGSMFVPAFIATYFPIGLRGLCIAVVLGLLLTTGDTFLLLLSSTLTEDIIRPAKPDIDDKKLLTIGRFICVAACIIIVILALYIPTITELFKIGGSAFGCSVFFPLFFGCFWKRVNTKAINFSMAFCCILSIVWDLFLKDTTGQSGSLIAGVASFVLCVFGSLYLNRRAGKAAARTI